MTDNVTNLLAAVDPADERAITRFLFEEVQVLDDWQFAKWLDFFHDDTMYWAPTQTDRYPRERAKRISAFGTSVYFEENKVQLKQRVDRLLTDQAWGEAPPSRARHLVSNVRVSAGEAEGEFAVKSNFLAYRSMGQRSQDMITGERSDKIVRAPESEWGYLIKERRILFDMAGLLIKNLTIFY
ncbi:aromatic-ring-hydroxylating dioxygenase subunit beta [Granulicoccus phenolivorans]|uniref:aromatic-ring-hydroxylating dioxygenase subunit beta n=1 Tax=Granulicoccus phenolivorans TaxID=266854 RepID=UPI00041D72FF|nr:aromatic-ring-hydroxylating dioxygenase subunit beta [Granulicoccus phenolivorans]